MAQKMTVADIAKVFQARVFVLAIESIMSLVARSFHQQLDVKSASCSAQFRAM